jgi:HSP20 family protein
MLGIDLEQGVESRCVSISMAEEGFTALAKQMSRWIEHVMGTDYAHYHNSMWRPAVNLYEDAEAFYLVADVAGVDAKTIDLQVQKQMLVLRGERLSPRPPAEKGRCKGVKTTPMRLHMMEINHGPFHRVLELPQEVDSKGIQACYRNGFLWVTMPKQA